MQHFSLAGEITEYFLFHEGNTMFYLCMRHFLFFSCRGNKRKETKNQNKEEADFPTWRAASIAPLLGTNANVFLPFLYVCVISCRLYGSFSSPSVWHLKQKQQRQNEGVAVADRGWGRAGDCFCHCCLHCLLDIEWRLLKCHDMTQTKKKNIFYFFKKAKPKFLFQLGGRGGNTSNNCSI